MSATCTRCGEDRSYELALGDQSGLCWREACGKLGTATRNFPITLPTCEPERPAESVVAHGARVLTFILQTSCTATLSDQELERAEIAAKYAIVARGILPQAATRISDARHLIDFILRERRQETTTMPAVVEGGQLIGKLGTGGPGDREPLTPTPRTEPPAGATVDLDPGDWQLQRVARQRDRVQF